MKSVLLSYGTPNSYQVLPTLVFQTTTVSALASRNQIPMTCLSDGNRSSDGTSPQFQVTDGSNKDAFRRKNVSNESNGGLFLSTLIHSLIHPRASPNSLWPSPRFCRFSQVSQVSIIFFHSDTSLKIPADSQEHI